MVRLVVALLGLICAAVTSAFAQSPVSFKNQQVTMVIGFPAGGGTDLAGRLIAEFLGRYLPGDPSIIVRNQPGTNGMTALNYLVQQTKPNGLQISMGSSSEVDPLTYRRANALYDPVAFRHVGGIGRSGLALVISADAEKRLYDKNASPVVMGSVGGVPRSGVQVAVWGIEYLGWNSKWVVGYQSTPSLMLALENGEIDMTSSGVIPLVNRLTLRSVSPSRG